MVKTNHLTGDVEKVVFEEYDFPVISSSGALSFVTKDSMMTNRELRVEIEETAQRWAEAQEQRKVAKTPPSNSQQWKMINLERGLYKSRLQLWTRYNTPIQCLVFIFLGFSLGIKKGRGHSKNSSALSLGLLLGYYALFFTAVSFIKKASLSPELGVMLPTLLLIGVAVHYYRKLDWAS